MYIFYYNFKRSIDEMPDEDFIDMISYLMFSSEDFEDEDWTFDEECEDEVASFFILCVYKPIIKYLPMSDFLIIQKKTCKILFTNLFYFKLVLQI